MAYPLSPSALATGVALVGKTGTGKTTSAKGGVEAVLTGGAEDTFAVVPGVRVCILDPIKSDWWGLTSSAAGRSPGFPFHILGGPHGHVPLHPTAGKAIGELVGRGDLPLSIIDMADFPMGGLQTFFADFAEALMKSMRGVVYLVLEEAHEFAPKERSNVGGESMAIYWAKKLFTAGRSKGIRPIVVTQRTQKLHNDLLGSCETLVAHKLKAPADQKPVKDWLKDNCDEATFAAVTTSLGKLRKGHAWVITDEGTAGAPLVFPPLMTFDNTKTPESSDGVHHVTTAPVDREKLIAIMGAAVKEAEENNVDKLKARVKALEAQLAGKAPVAIDADAIEKARQAGYLAGAKDGLTSKAKRFDHIATKLADATKSLGEIGELVTEGIEFAASGKVELEERSQEFQRVDIPHIARGDNPPPPAPQATRSALPPSRQPSAPPSEGLTGPQQRILDALAWWEAIGQNEPTRAQVAFVAGYSPNGGAFIRPLGELKTAGLVAYPTPGQVKTLPPAFGKGRAPGQPPTTLELHSRVLALLSGPQERILRPLLRAYPKSMSRADVAAAAGYEPLGGAFIRPLGELKTLGMVTYPSNGVVAAKSILFVAKK